MNDYRGPAEPASQVSPTRPSGRGWLSHLLARLKTPPAPLRPAELLYNSCVTCARDPVLFRDGGVPDTLDGRFDALALTVTLVMLRIEAADDLAPAVRGAVQTALVERLIDDMDRTLREIGVGDMNVGKQVRAMAAACSGRHLAYRDALAAGDEGALSEALVRNLYRGDDPGARPLKGVADWITARRALLAACDIEDLMEGRL